MIASKYLNDEGESEALTNSEWGEVGCKSKPALDLMERKFLAAIVSHAPAHTHTHTHTHAFSHIHTCTCMHTPICVFTHTHTLALHFC